MKELLCVVAVDEVFLAAVVIGVADLRYECKYIYIVYVNFVEHREREQRTQT